MLETIRDQRSGHYCASDSDVPKPDSLWLLVAESVSISKADIVVIYIPLVPH
jgi:hypothetical protein